MNANRAKAKERDAKIIKFIEQRRYVKREHIEQEFFRTGQAKVISSRRLKRLHELEKINRFRPDVDSSYVYYPADRQRSDKWTMFVGINEIYYLISSQLKQWQKILRFELELQFPHLRADGLIFLQTTIGGKGIKLFIEYERSRHEFDKIPKYCQLKESNWKQYDWAKSSQGYSFPIILVVTESRGRKEYIKQLVREQNSSDIVFRVIAISELREKGLKTILGG